MTDSKLIDVDYKGHQLLRMVDPRINYSKQKDKYITTLGGTNISYKTFISSSYSTSSIVWNCPPPSPLVAVDRAPLMKFYIQAVVNGWHDASGVGSLLQPGKWAPRAFPINNSINTMSATINNNTVSINQSDVLQPLLRYYNYKQDSELNYSTTPNYLDNAQKYTDVVGSVKNPLGTYGDNETDLRGAFPYTLTDGPLDGSGNATTTTVQFAVSEHLFLSPFVHKTLRNYKSGFIGIQNLDFNITLNSQLEKFLLSLNNTGLNISSVAVSFYRAPEISFTYITPPSNVDIPVVSKYDLFDVNRYVTENVSLSPNASTTITSNNIQLNSVPKRLYVCVRRRNADKSMFATDTFTRIDSVKMNFANKSGLYSSATSEQLYKISVANGYSRSWDAWSSKEGSVLCLEFGKDIELNADESQSEKGTWQLQMDVNCTNLNSTETLNLALYIIVVNEGIMAISNGKSSSYTGVLSKTEIKDAPLMSATPAELDAYDDVYGGSWLSDTWDGIKSVGRFIKDNKLVSRIASIIPHPASQVVGKVASAVGLGRKKGRKATGRKAMGGSYMGGASMSRAQLKKQIMQNLE